MSAPTQTRPLTLLTRKEAAKFIRVGLTSVQKLINSGELPSALYCGHRYVRVEDAEEFIAKRVAESKAGAA